MSKIFIILGIFSVLLSAKYLTNKDCKECHGDIYNEYESSYHSKNYFNDELHRKVANKVSTKTYDCASCHMPAADNIKDLIDGKARPDKNNKTHRDGISCFYCHQIAFVKKAHFRNKIILARQAEGYKPTLYGSLKDPEDSDKHTMTHSPIYRKYACIGCHSHKRNAHDVVVFDAMNGSDDGRDCIKCHMPEVPGKVEDMDKKNRKTHHSHRFLGIHDASMRAKGIDLHIAVKGDNEIEVKLENKMPHPLIIQASRLKYLQVEVIRDNKVIWKNFKDSPLEDKKGAFVTEFADQNGKFVAIPAFAYKRGFVNNLKAKETKTLVYKTVALKKGDVIKASMFVILAKPSCSDVLPLKDRKLTEPLLMKEVVYKF